MIFTEMVSEAEILYESINSSAAPGFTSTEWGKILTAAQRKVVLWILREGVTSNAFNQLAIERLIQQDSYTAFTTETHFKHANGTSAQRLNVATKAFNTSYFWVLDEYVKTGSGITEITNIPIIKITFDFYRKNINNPFRIPSSDYGYWMIQYNNTPVFITDGTAVTGYYVVGVYHPDTYPIDSTHNCVLNTSLHSKIVEEAVSLARMSVVDAQGYQLSLTEFSK